MILSKGTAKNKKLKAVFLNKDDKPVKTIQFGDNRYSDYTIHKDEDRMHNYINRHRKDPQKA